MTDPIADMLTRIRNGYMARLATVAIPYSKIKLELAELLKNQGLIGEVSSKEAERLITVDLKYISDKPAMIHLRRVSKPGLRVYSQANKIRRVRGGLGLVIVSTSQGLMTGSDARKRKWAEKFWRRFGNEPYW